jgi:hypothetical protein
MHEMKISRDEVAQLVGDVSDETIVAILETGATAEDIETALQWIASADDVMGKSGKALSGRAASVYDILIAEEAASDER